MAAATRKRGWNASDSEQARVRAAADAHQQDENRPERKEKLMKLMTPVAVRYALAG